MYFTCTYRRNRRFEKYFYLQQGTRYTNLENVILFLKGNYRVICFSGIETKRNQTMRKCDYIQLRI